MSALAVEVGAVNLGQGFPDTDGPTEVLDAAVDAIRSGVNQYPPGLGMPVLRAAIADHQSRFYGLDYDVDSEVLVTAGATEAIAGAMLGLLQPDDEVIVFEPMYDSYQACIALAGARAVPVTLRPPDYRPDVDRVRTLIGPRTRAILVNSPHNPTGMLMDEHELAAIAGIAAEHDLVIISDEVYEHLVFDGLRHRSMAEFPGARERTLVISSGGKTFRTTGWKIGWVCGPPHLVAATRAAKQFLTYVNGAPFQPAIARGLGLPDEYFRGVADELSARRDELVPALHSVGFDVYPTRSTYFVTVDAAPVAPGVDGKEFCARMARDAGVVAIPNVVFYSEASKDAGRSLVRFAFCKRPEVIAEAVERLQGWKP
ncbi:MAG: aminotransferase class I/II-fold pyridoxal phosphate-dependent enzyme [Actinomycetota bacterium]